jgi:uncharacterized protein YbjT (DUF2867 family)
MTRIAIAGAGGFVGRNLVARLCASHRVRALSRSRPEGLPADCGWTETELFSARSTIDAVRDVDVAIYLVHSMMPSSRLFQGNFHDTDLLLADNFARACRTNGVRRIIYVGGLAPEGYVSPHLESRLEVESVLRSSGVPTTVLRAGMIVGPGGSSFEILRALVKKLPVMILPRWTRSRTQAVAIEDVVRVVEAAVDGAAFAGGTFDVVNGESLTYEDILRATARALGLRRTMIPAPIASTGFSKLWVTIFGNSTYELVSPLIDSLQCDLPQLKPGPLIAPLIGRTSFEEMVRDAARHGGARPAARPRRTLLHEDSVRSIQRLPAVDRDCDWIAREYVRWLPSFFRAVVGVAASLDGRSLKFRLAFLPAPLLVLESVAEEFDVRRAKFHIVGGWLTKTTDTGWLEFRQVDGGKYLLTSIHEFVPRLPWPLYRLTQAPLHRLVMRMFGRHLERAAAPPPGLGR